ncbi:serine/threonine-protein kinase RIO3-like isoform X2 [Varroa jacobsoni]|uniref:Serine/threonine-protein kinase RIO3 n=1 Tax=Varroa destructor TaxID=109461 RepID=A0A7M7J1T0_VARDE|nr:serine/threonine-protein kinase RIO3-like isoform X2 [Varroa destructor]XP_022701484.1 serine/threonine-protein kinase RIO3-like isoform X2 [Varroa jacobsoni]
MLLQEQFDHEAQVEKNRHEVLGISLGSDRDGSNARKLKNGDSIGEEDSSSDSEIEDVDRFATQARTDPAIGFRGFSRNQDGIMKTKHDAEMCGRRHACKVMELTSSIATGDGSGFDMKLNNSVYNSLRVHSKMEERRAARLHDKKEKATVEQSMDVNTRLLIYKLINRQILDEVNGCISTGKESTVFHARGGSNEEFNVPEECAIKVFKTTLNEFKNRSDYIKEDFRFKDRCKLNPRKTIHVWAEKELNNLQKIHRAGINCPQAIILKKHVLVMTFIGSEGKPAPKLRDAHLNRDQLREAWYQCFTILKRLYSTCKLVHADLSEYNLLWHLGHVWVIDVSQAVDQFHPHALEFLLRDCTNISEFFRKQGLPGVPAAKALFRDVSGLQLPGEGAELLSQIRNFVREEDLLKRENEQFYDQSDRFEIMFGHETALLNVAKSDTAAVTD